MVWNAVEHDDRYALPLLKACKSSSRSVAATDVSHQIDVGLLCLRKVRAQELNETITLAWEAIVIK